MGLFGRAPKVVLPWSQQKGYTGGHRKGRPKRGSQHRKFTTRGSLFGSTGRSTWLWGR